MNKVILLGNLTRDIELRYTPAGTAIASTGIAVTEKYKKQDGTTAENVLFIDLAIWGKTGEFANQYLKKGVRVLIEGKLKLDQWQDQNGGNRSKHTVTVENLKSLTCRQNAEQRPQSGQPQGGQTQGGAPSYSQAAGQVAGSSAPDIDPDEIPF